VTAHQHASVTELTRPSYCASRPPSHNTQPGCSPVLNALSGGAALMSRSPTSSSTWGKGGGSRDTAAHSTPVRVGAVRGLTSREPVHGCIQETPPRGNSMARQTVVSLQAGGSRSSTDSLLHSPTLHAVAPCAWPSWHHHQHHQLPSSCCHLTTAQHSTTAHAECTEHQRTMLHTMPGAEVPAPATRLCCPALV
jgi:hypothetical protein